MEVTKNDVELSNASLLTNEDVRAASDMASKPIDIGALSIRIDSSSVDNFVERLERAIVAFKTEWNRAK